MREGNRLECVSVRVRPGVGTHARFKWLGHRSSGRRRLRRPVRRRPLETTVTYRHYWTDGAPLVVQQGPNANAAGERDASVASTEDTDGLLYAALEAQASRWERVRTLLTDAVPST